MSTGNYILHDDGSVVREPDLLTWARWFETAERHIALNELPGDVRVSTVFLGVDHNFGFSGPPILFETMVFGGVYDGWQERYSSKDEAIAGHARVLAMVKSELPKEASRP